MSAAIEVLIVDDELEISSLIAGCLKDEGFSTRVAVDDKTTFAAIKQRLPNVIILDVWLEGSELDGLGILEFIKSHYPQIPVIVISGHATIQDAVKAIKLGADEYIEKPFGENRLLTTVKLVCELARLKKENIGLKNRIASSLELIGISPFTTKLKTDIAKTSSSNGRVLISGPIGSGKELVAKLIYKKSKRADTKFISFCPTDLTSEKIEHELFGEYEKTHHNSHLNKKLSLLEMADGGVLYIDEIADLPLDSQAKLIKFLQDQKLEKQDGKTTKLDLRLISSSGKDLQQLVDQGKFREDLYNRISVVHIKLLPLTERKEDIPILVSYFVGQITKNSGIKERKFSQDAIISLQNYFWPGNIRQLRNVVEWSLIMSPLQLCKNEEITVDMLPLDISSAELISLSENNDEGRDLMDMDLRCAREAFEKQYIIFQLHKCLGNISKASYVIGMERSALHRKMKSLGILYQEK